MNEGIDPTAEGDNLDRQYAFIGYTETLPLVADTAKIVAYFLNRWLNTRLSVTKLRKMRRIPLEYRKGSAVTQLTVDVEQVIDHVRTTRSFRAEQFGLPSVESDWLDYSLGIAKPDGPIARSDWSEFAKFALLTPFGDQFPISPCIDREGAAYASFQQPIQENVVTLHRRLVNTSYAAPSLNNPWRNDLRMLLNECVSLIDITLHQLYFMAQYRGAEKGWIFNRDALGSRQGVRLEDKLRWIGLITGRPLDDADEERKALKRLKAIRNHFNHFDPPCVAYTVEDVVSWLNDVPLIGRLAWKIRDKLDAQLSQGIIEIITLPRCIFLPRNPTLPRVPQPPDVGYSSTTWPDSSKGPNR